MKLVCSVCDRSANNHNLSCIETNCPIGKNRILGNGQIVGDVKIVQLQQITKTHCFYTGLRDKTEVLLKVANQEQGAKNRLVDEARFLIPFAQQRSKVRNSRLSFLNSTKDPYPGIPHLLPAYANADIRHFPYGQTQIEGQEFIFTVWSPVKGIPLDQYLSAIREPWFDNVAYTITQLAHILEIMHQNKLIHAKLTPDSIWVYEDKKHILRASLMDFGLLRNELKRNDIIWLHENSNVAYIAPEIANATNNEIDTYQSPLLPLIDIYGLGLLLYEMLAGASKYSYMLRSRAQIIKDVQRERDTPLIRKDIEETNRSPILTLAKTTTARKPNERTPQDMQKLIRHIQGIAGKIPPAQPPHTIAQQVWRVTLMAGIIAGLYLLLTVMSSG